MSGRSRSNESRMVLDFMVFLWTKITCLGRRLLEAKFTALSDCIVS